MKKPAIILILLACFYLTTARAQVPAAISIQPPDATAYELLTLTFNPALSCEAGTPKSLVGSPAVRIHSGVKLYGLLWQNVVAFDQAGVNGQSTELTKNANGTYSITYTPALFYGVTAPDEIEQICCIFNDGSGWEHTGKDKENGTGQCVDFYIGLAPLGIGEREGIRLAANTFPNPCQQKLTIGFSLSRQADVTVSLINTLGQPVFQSLYSAQAAGYYEEAVDAAMLPRGVYLYVLKAGNATLSGRVVKQ